MEEQELEMKIYERMCSCCPHAKECHENCEYCEDFEQESQKQREFEIKAEIRRVNAILRNKPSPHAYKQNKKQLERLERKLRQCQGQSITQNR